MSSVACPRCRRRWGGRHARAARARLLLTLPCLCWRCGQPIRSARDMDVGHVTALADGGPCCDPANQAPEHRACNRAAGAAAGNRARAPAPPPPSTTW